MSTVQPYLVEERVLTPEAQKDNDEFRNWYGSGNCSCHISPPCSCCTHPGNPRNQEENDDCWTTEVYVVEPLSWGTW